MNPDILFGTETWVDDKITDSQIFPSGYKDTSERTETVVEEEY